MSSVKAKHSVFYHPFPSLCRPSTLNKANVSFAARFQCARCLLYRPVDPRLLSFPCPALILEEIAIDCHNKETEERLLQEAHDLHLSSLQLAKKAFGEFNVQTAKHYGNLGRLYQSMRKFKVGRREEFVCVCLSCCNQIWGNILGLWLKVLFMVLYW